MGVRVDDVLELGARGEDGLDGLGQPRAGGKFISAFDEKSWAQQQCCSAQNDKLIRCTICSSDISLEYITAVQ